MKLTMSELQARRDVILDIANRNKAGNVRVFGSVVRGEATDQSDVDFLVTFKAGASLLDLVGLADDLQDALGQKVDVVSDDSLNERIRARIMSEARPL